MNIRFAIQTTIKIALNNFNFPKIAQNKVKLMTGFQRSIFSQLLWPAELALQIAIHSAFDALFQMRAANAELQLSLRQLTQH